MKSRTIELQNCKRLLIGGVLLVILTLAGFCHAGDMLRGVNFQDGQKVTAAQLNGLVDNGSILPAFYTSKSAKTNVSAGDLFLSYDVTAGAFRKITGANLILNNTDWVNGLNEITALDNQDQFVFYDVSAGILAKAALTNLFVFTNQPLALQNQMFTLLEWDPSSGIYYQLPIPTLVSNLSTNVSATLSITNLAKKSSLSPADAFLITDVSTGVNKQTTLSNIFNSRTNVGQMLVGTDTNGVPTPISAGLGISLTNSVISLSNSTISGISVPTTLSVSTNAHNLGTVPGIVRVVLRNVTTDAGYQPGDEIDISMVTVSASASPVLQYTADGTNVYLTYGQGNANWAVWNRNNASSQPNITKANWNLKIYARP